LRAFQPALQHAGYEFDLCSFPRRWWQRLQLPDRLRSDNILFQRRLLSSWEIGRMRRRAKTLLFDFDDAVWLRDSFAGQPLQSKPRLRRFAGMMRMMDAVIAGNEFLAEQARSFLPSDRVHVIPTCIDVQRYPMAEHKRRCVRGPALRRSSEFHANAVLRNPTRQSDSVQLVWIGSASTLQGLEQQRELLEEIGRKGPHISLKLICDQFLKLQNLRVMPSTWSEETEAAELAAADIGIAWMPDDDWSRGKCGLKVLQYMADGLPVIANPVGVHNEMIRHGENGYLANSPAEWVEAIDTLAHDPELRLRMGRAGRQRVEQEYSVEIGAERWLRVLSDLDTASEEMMHSPSLALRANDR
jgi:glycosyltransferase involved in cell wall biosynthesis